MSRYQRGLVWKIVFWITGLVVLALAAIFGINSTDEELSELAKKAAVVPPAPRASPGNGYTDYLALRDDGIEERLRRACSMDVNRCLKFTADNPDLVELIARHDAFTKSYRAMREKPEFVDLLELKGPYDPFSSYRPLFSGQRLSLVSAASMANRGDLRSAIIEIETENAFHRRVAAGSRQLITKLIAFALLQRDALFVSELARIRGGQATALLGRLRAIVRPLTDREADVRESLKIDSAQIISWMRTRHYVRLPDDIYESAKVYESVKEHLGGSGSRPWWDPVAPYLYRPHESVNYYAAQTDILIRVASVPPKEFSRAAEAAQAEVRALASRGLASMLINPVGRDHPSLRVIPGRSGEADGITPSIRQAHETQALYTLVALQIGLREAGATNLSDIGQALDGPLSKSHPDPFTGEPMRFDAKTRTIGFDATARMGLSADLLLKQYGRVAVELAIDP